MKIAHISDLHVSGYNFVKEWGENLIDLLHEAKPDVLVVTGDITDDGYIYEYELAKQYLERIKVKTKIIVPGNHDARNEGYKIFEEIFGTRYPFYEDEHVVSLGIDSTEPDIDDGHIGRENYPLIREKLSNHKQKVLLLHHHLIPIPGTGRERNIPVDAGDVLKLCIEANINYVLSGHKHFPWIWRLENTYFITAGTATSHRLKGFSYPSFNLLHLTETGMKFIKIVDVKEKKVKVTRKL
ncbi:MAG: metallophosphoesterase [Candidatus Desulfofervidaceae bacterium]|nr:metallophosphoesterase [Candidatus Desulfofervidaceae bacterium]